MKNYKLLAALNSLSSRECQDFRRYVRSPFFTRNITVSRLLDILLENLPKDSEPTMDENQVFQTLFPDKTFHKQRLREAFADLFSLLKSYLAYQEYQQNPYQEEVYALAQFRKRQLNKAFGTQLHSLSRQLDQVQEISSDYYKIRSDMALEANGFYGQQQVRVFDHNLQQRADSFDLYYLIIKLRESCEMLNRKHVMNADYELHLLPELEDWIQHRLPEAMQVPSVLIYRQIYLSLKHGDQQEHFAKLAELLESHQAELDQEEVRAMYKYAQNYCIRQINQGNSRYLNRLFDLYNNQLNNSRIFTNGMLSHTDYKNIATVGLRIHAYEWVHTFLETYRESVSPAFRMNVYNYCMASLYLEKAAYAQTIRLLQQVNFTDIHYRISAQYLLLKAYYETEDWDGLEYLIKAFVNYVRRTKEISPHNRTNHKNFLRILKKLIRLNERYGKERHIQQAIKDLQAQIEDLPQIPHDQWLREKVDQLLRTTHTNQVRLTDSDIAQSPEEE
ncbi:MAG: hypothetical protein AAF587_28545 [Bacteroidota bacterium]